MNPTDQPAPTAPRWTISDSPQENEAFDRPWIVSCGQSSFRCETNSSAIWLAAQLNAPAPEVTEAQVVARLHRAVEELADKTGNRYAFMRLEIGMQWDKWVEPRWTSYINNGDHLTRQTCDEAIVAQVNLMNPAARAARLRAEAAEKLGQADALAPRPTGGAL